MSSPRLFIALTAITGLVASILLSCDEPSPRRRPSVRRCVIEVRYEPPHFPSALEVEVEGRRRPLTLLDADQGRAGLWGADLWVMPGWRRYALRLDGRALPDPKRSLTTVEVVEGEEQTYTLIDVPDCERGRWFRVSAQSSTRGSGSARFQLAYERALTSAERERRPEADDPNLEGVALDPAQLTVRVNGDPYPYQLEGELLTIHVERSAGQLDFGKHHLSISGIDRSGEEFETFRAPFWLEPQPHRWERGVMYQVVLDRLSPPSLPLDVPPSDQASDQASDTSTLDVSAPSIGERWGGQLTSLVELLSSGYLTELGVTSIWISPLSPNPTGAWTGVEGGAPRYEGYHGYWSIAPREVGAEWGDAETLERVVALAHERGMRVIVDVALNHVHEQHPYVSEHPEWFSPPGCLCGRPGCDWASNIDTCRFTRYLPDVRWRGFEVMWRQVEDAIWWVERFDLDGLRVDAVPMMPRRVTRLLSAEMRRRFEGLRTRHLLLGETFTGPREWSRIGWYLGADGLDGQFDFPLMWGLRAAIAWESEPMDTLRDLWRAGEAAWSGSGSIMGRFIGNHDVTRFVSEAEGADLSDPWMKPPEQGADEVALGRLWLATAFTLTLPGLPVLYYGDEVGLAGANDPDNRRPFWPLTYDQPSALEPLRERHFERVAQLGKLRACLDALSHPESELQFLSSDEERLSFIRGRSGREAIVVLQRAASASPSRLAIPTPQRANDRWRDALSGVEVRLAERRDSRITQLMLPPIPAYSAYILVRGPDARCEM